MLSECAVKIETPRGPAGYVPLASQNPHPIIVYSVANYRPHLSLVTLGQMSLSFQERNSVRAEC